MTIDYLHVVTGEVGRVLKAHAQVQRPVIVADDPRHLLRVARDERARRPAAVALE